MAIGLIGLAIGYLAGALAAGRRIKDTESRYNALTHDFEVVSAVNVRLMERVNPASAAAGDKSGDEPSDERFFELYDDAKRCLHRTLDAYNATAPRPLVISRDGRNLLQVLSALPERSFSEDIGEDAGVRAWLRRVFEMEIKRRATRGASRGEAVLALERERELWRAPLKKRA
jgi:hypothetical protein